VLLSSGTDDLNGHFSPALPDRQTGCNCSSVATRSVCAREISKHFRGKIRFKWLSVRQKQSK